MLSTMISSRIRDSGSSLFRVLQFLNSSGKRTMPMAAGTMQRWYVRVLSITIWLCDVSIIVVLLFRIFSAKLLL